MKRIIAILIFFSITSYSFSQIFRFEYPDRNIMINKDGSYNSYLFIDTLHFENEGVIRSRHDGHEYLFSDSCDIKEVKDYRNIIQENNVYIYQPNYFDFLIPEFNRDYFLNVILRKLSDDYLIMLQNDYITDNFIRRKFVKKPTGYYLCVVKGYVYNYLTYKRSADIYSYPLIFPDDNAFYKIVIPYWK